MYDEGTTLAGGIAAGGGPGTPGRTSSDIGENGSGATADATAGLPKTGAAATTDPERGDAAISDSARDSAAISDPARDSAAISDPARDSAAISDPARDDAAVTDSGQGDAAVGDPEPERADTAAEIAAAVQNGVITPEEVVAATLERIRGRDRKLNAFSVVRVDAARAEARAVAERPDLDVLPLAGVPIAVKNNVDVAGEVTRGGSLAVADRRAAGDHTVVRRLRAAGAVVVGLTTMPEFGLWGVTDGPDRITRGPWNQRFSAGGSSGGAGAAVAAGMVPVAHGNDGLGSIRIPAACCGLVGIKPGRGLVPAEVGVDSWHGMTENGVLATTVADAALVLSVLADRPDLTDPGTPPTLRIGLATAAPLPLIRVDRAWTAAADKAAAIASADGHTIGVAELPYQGAAFAATLRWLAGAAAAADAVAYPERLQRRTRTHARLGRLALQSGLLRPSQVDRVEARLQDYFERYDVVITPTLATPPPRAGRWHARPWFTNVVANARFSPFTPLWNLVGWPAITVPMGFHPRTGTPVAAQLAGPPGSESTLLGLAAQLEAAHPWPRTAA